MLYESPRHKLMQRVQLYLEDDFLEEIKLRKPRSLSMSAFCALCIEERLDKGFTIPAYRVGAGHQTPEENQPSPQQQSQPTDKATSAPSKAVQSSLKKADRVVPQCVYHHSDLISEFWRSKKGSKSETAWKLLMTELEKIQDAYGDKRVDEQLRLAINGQWQSVSLRNLQRFENNSSSSSNSSSFDFSAINGMSI